MDYEKVKKEIADYISGLVGQGKFQVSTSPGQSRNYAAEIQILAQSIAILTEAQSKEKERAAPKE